MNKISISAIIVYLFAFSQATFSISQPPSASLPDPLSESIKRGKMVYEANCLSCHMANGKGIAGVYPPLAQADYLMEDKARSIQQTMEGVQGEMLVNGKKYNGIMPASGLDDEEIADVLNYIRNSWGNQGEIILPKEVADQR